MSLSADQKDVAPAKSERCGGQVSLRVYFLQGLGEKNHAEKKAAHR
jgi:hypothetical protein